MVMDNHQLCYTMYSIVILLLLSTHKEIETISLPLFIIHFHIQNNALCLLRTERALHWLYAHVQSYLSQFHHHIFPVYFLYFFSLAAAKPILYLCPNVWKIKFPFCPPGQCGVFVIFSTNWTYNKFECCCHCYIYNFARTLCWLSISTYKSTISCSSCSFYKQHINGYKEFKYTQTHPPTWISGIYTLYNVVQNSFCCRYHKKHLSVMAKLSDAPDTGF